MSFESLASDHAPARRDLRTAWTAGRLPHALLLSGEAGIGKTRLGAELRTQALARGCQWLEGRYDKEGSIPLKPYAEAERTYLSTQPEIPLRDLAGSYSAEMARAFPALALDLVSATQESGRNVPFVLQHR